MSDDRPSFSLFLWALDVMAISLGINRAHSQRQLVESVCYRTLTARRT
jgi:hypothetical protein